MINLNRDQKKTLEKSYRIFGKSRSEAKKLAQQMYDIDKIRLSGTGDKTPPQDFQEDDRFMLDIGRIKSRKNFERMSDPYKQFVESSNEKIFTAHVERGGIISAKEAPTWFFWSGDLIKAKDEPDEDTASKK